MHAHGRAVSEDAHGRVGDPWALPHIPAIESFNRHKRPRAAAVLGKGLVALYRLFGAAACIVSGCVCAYVCRGLTSKMLPVQYLVKAAQAGWLAVAPELRLPALGGEGLVHTPAAQRDTARHSTRVSTLEGQGTAGARCVCAKGKAWFLGTCHTNSMA
jgi:hypothetical protein